MVMGRKITTKRETGREKGYVDGRKRSGSLKGFLGLATCGSEGEGGGGGEQAVKDAIKGARSGSTLLWDSQPLQVLRLARTRPILPRESRYRCPLDPRRVPSSP